MNELALFAGGGGGILGGALLGWTTVGAVEIEPYPRQILLARQRDGLLPRFPIWDDVSTFDGKPWRGLVDVVSGGFPCQDISCAGQGAGINGTRSGLWSEMCRIIREVRPKFAFMENSPMLTSRGLGTVLGDLAEAGYDAEWMVLGAADVGAPHRRERIWILARDSSTLPDPDLSGSRRGCSFPPTAPPSFPDSDRLQRAEREHDRPALSARGSADELDTRRNMADSRRVGRDEGSLLIEGGRERALMAFNRRGERTRNISNSNLSGRQKQRLAESTSEKLATLERGSWWKAEPDVGRVADGVAARVDRLKALGNGQVPLVAATAFLTLLKRFD